MSMPGGGLGGGRSFPRAPRLLASVRFRLTALYSTLLFALAALVVGAIYAGVHADVGGPRVVEPAQGEVAYRKRDGSVQYLGRFEVATFKDFEQAVDSQTLATLGRYSLGALLGLFLASLLLGWVLSGRALRPVREMAEAARHISATDLSRRIRLQGPDDEFHYLADTLDSMLARLDEAFNAQRRMLDDASHELRSPLAIISANVEGVLLDPAASDAERRAAAEVVLRAVARMDRLVDDLLAAGRRAAPAFADTAVDLAELAREAGEEFARLAARRGLGLRHVPGPAPVSGDPDALRRAVGNLLSNAVRLAPVGSDIVVGTGRQDGWSWAAVRDAGPGIATEHQARVFDRFWRSDPPPGAPGPAGAPGPTGAAADEPTLAAADGHTGQAADGHTGLGLSIVRQIVEGHGGAVRLHSRAGSGSTFVLWLPAAGSPSTAAGPPGPLSAPASGPAPARNPLADPLPLSV